MKLSAFIEKERLFLIAVFSLLLLFFFSPTGVEREAGPALSPVGAPEVLREALAAGRFPLFLAELFGLTLAVLLTLLIAGLYLNFSAWRRKDREIFAPGPPPEVEWGVWAVVKLAVYAAFLLMVARSLATAALGGLFPTPAFLIGAVLFQNILVLLLVFGFLKRSGYSVASLRFKTAGWRFQFKEAFSGYAFFFPYLILTFQISRVFDLPANPHPLVAPLLEKGSPVIIAALFIIAVVLAPLAEEIFFRGFLFPSLKRRIALPGAVLLSAALFATLHLSAGGWLSIFGLGIFLAYSYEKTGLLLVPVLIHGIHNALFLSIAVLVHQGIKVCG